jgi:hypothetical protein
MSPLNQRQLEVPSHNYQKQQKQDQTEERGLLATLNYHVHNSGRHHQHATCRSTIEGDIRRHLNSNK